MHKLDFNGQRAAVTGAAEGIGAASLHDAGPMQSAWQGSQNSGIRHFHLCVNQEIGYSLRQSPTTWALLAIRDPELLSQRKSMSRRRSARTGMSGEVLSWGDPTTPTPPSSTGASHSGCFGYSWEGPQHQVTLSPFYLAVTEVTNAQYRRFRTEHRRG